MQSAGYSYTQLRKRDLSQAVRGACVWGRLGGQNRSLSCCCFSPLTTRAVRFGGTEELSDPRDQPGAQVPRCKRSHGPGDVLLFKSLCSQMSFQIIWMPGAGTVPEGSWRWRIGTVAATGLGRRRRKATSLWCLSHKCCSSQML